MKLFKRFPALVTVLVFTCGAYAQEYNCNIKQLEAATYDFVLKNLDSVKLGTPQQQKLTLALEYNQSGAVKRSGFYSSYGLKEQKEVKVWKGLEKYVKESFALCPDSHFYDTTGHITTTVIPLPLSSEELSGLKKQIESAPGYLKPGEGLSQVARDSKYTIDIKQFSIGKKIMEPFTKEGNMDFYRSKMVKLSDIFSIGFEIVKAPGGKTNYLKYTLYEKVDNKGVIITSEQWRPIINNQVVLSVKGIRDEHPGVRHVKVGEEFDINMTITFKK